MKVISSEDLRVATLSGSVFVFTAGEVTECSDEIGIAAMQMGAKSADGGVSTPPPVEEAVTESRATYYGEAEPEEEAPAADLLAVMESLIDEGDPTNFKADGGPKAAVVNKAVGRTVSTSEREAAWEEALNN